MAARLTTGRVLGALLAITLIAVAVALLSQRDRERPEDPHAAPTGPSTVIRGMMQRQAAREARERQARAAAFERLVTADGGL